MAPNGRLIKPMPLLEEDVPYLDLAFREAAGEVEWNLEEEGELAVDVLETSRDIIVRSAIAGVQPEDLAIEATTDTLTIRGARKACQDFPFAETHIEECHWGNFSRTILLPHTIRVEEIVATMRHGVLTVLLPKSSADSEVPVLSL